MLEADLWALGPGLLGLRAKSEVVVTVAIVAPIVALCEDAGRQFFGRKRCDIGGLFRRKCRID